jgi:hypothetical protein
MAGIYKMPKPKEVQVAPDKVRTEAAKVNGNNKSVASYVRDKAKKQAPQSKEQDD